MKTYLKLRPRHRLFIEKYIECGCNGSEAIRQLGVEHKRPDVAAAKILARPEVKLAIEERWEDLLRQAGIRPERILLELAAVAFFNPQDLLDANGDLLPMRQWPKRGASAIGGFDVERRASRKGDEEIVTTTLKPRGPSAGAKIDALKLLGLYAKIPFAERREHSGPNGGPIPVAAAALISHDATEMDAARAYLKMLTGE